MVHNAACASEQLISHQPADTIAPISHTINSPRSL